MYSVILKKEVTKFLEKHKWEIIVNDFERNLIVLLKNPFDCELNIKPLRWLKNNYRLRIWKYRFLYYIVEKEICIYFYKWWSRWDIYK